MLPVYKEVPIYINSEKSNQLFRRFLRLLLLLTLTVHPATTKTTRIVAQLHQISPRSNFAIRSMFTIPTISLYHTCNIYEHRVSQFEICSGTIVFKSGKPQKAVKLDAELTWKIPCNFSKDTLNSNLINSRLLSLTPCRKSCLNNLHYHRLRARSQMCENMRASIIYFVQLTVPKRRLVFYGI